MTDELLQKARKLKYEISKKQELINKFKSQYPNQIRIYSKSVEFSDNGIFADGVDKISLEVGSELYNIILNYLENELSKLVLEFLSL